MNVLGTPVAPVPFLGVAVHGPAGVGALFEAIGPNGPTHSVAGLGPFDGWPKWKTIQHQQMYSSGSSGPSVAGSS